MKKMIMSEKQERILINSLNEEASVIKKGKPYAINPDKVMVVKKYLDNNIKKGEYERIVGGYPKKEPVYAVLSSRGEILNTMIRDRMIDMLMDKFQKMFSDETESGLFFNQVLDDWYNDKIGIFGTLSVNHL